VITQEEVTQHGLGAESHQEDTMDRQKTVHQSIAFRFSFQIITGGEGLAFKGDAGTQKTSTVPQRASKPVQVTNDVEQEYDDNSVSSMPRSAVRFCSTTEPQPTRTTGPTAVAPVTTHRVSGSTRFLLWVVLVLGLAFLFNGIVLPAINTVLEQVRYGNARIATYDMNGRHWITEETEYRVRIVVSSADNQHNQVLVMPVSGVTSHALVTLAQKGVKIEVAVNGTYIAVLAPDGNGYKWGTN